MADRKLAVPEPRVSKASVSKTKRHVLFARCKKTQSFGFVRVRAQHLCESTRRKMTEVVFGNNMTEKKRGVNVAGRDIDAARGLKLGDSIVHELFEKRAQRFRFG